MSVARVVVGLGFGDEGKGTVVDHLVRTKPVTAVVRWNGGPQASHHVVLPDGRWHGFSQFGAGTFHPNVRTHLAKGMLVEPWNLVNEDLVLREKGVHDTLARTTIDPRCVVVGSWHKLLGQVRELVRGRARHGSVGMGVGTAIEFAKSLGDDTLVMGDLALGREKIREKVAKAVGLALSTSVSATVEVRDTTIMNPAGFIEAAALVDEFKRRRALDVDAITDWLHGFGRSYGRMLRHDEEALSEFFARGDVVFEGAQGLLLDPVLGFPPHVTKTRMTPHVAKELSPGVRCSILGVLRAFGHRHGVGPFPSERTNRSLLAGEHNRENRWQGPFRTGDFDLVSAKYAALACDVDGIALTCLDRLGDRPRVVTSWHHPGPPPAWLDERAIWEKDGGLIRITSLKPPVDGKPVGPEWSAFVSECTPAFVQVFNGPSDLLSYLEDKLEAPITMTSWGPTWKDKAASRAPMSPR